MLCGLVAGLALLLGGAHLLGKRKTYLAEGLTGLGASLLHLLLWGAYGPLQVLAELLPRVRRDDRGQRHAGADRLGAQPRRTSRWPGCWAVYLHPRAAPRRPVRPGSCSRSTCSALLAAMLTLAVRGRYRLVEAASFAAALFYAQAFAPSIVPRSGVVGGAEHPGRDAAAGPSSPPRCSSPRAAPAASTACASACSPAQVLAYAGVLELELGWNPHVPRLRRRGAGRGAARRGRDAGSGDAAAEPTCGLGRRGAHPGGSGVGRHVCADRDAGGRRRGPRLRRRARRAIGLAPGGLRGARAGERRRGEPPVRLHSGARGLQRADVVRADHRVRAGRGLRRPARGWVVAHRARARGLRPAGADRRRGLARSARSAPTSSPRPPARARGPRPRSRCSPRSGRCARRR